MSSVAEVRRHPRSIPRRPGRPNRWTKRPRLSRRSIHPRRLRPRLNPRPLRRWIPSMIRRTTTTRQKKTHRKKTRRKKTHRKKTHQTTMRRMRMHRMKVRPTTKHRKMRPKMTRRMMTRRMMTPRWTSCLCSRRHRWCRRHRPCRYRALPRVRVADLRRHHLCRRRSLSMRSPRRSSPNVLSIATIGVGPNRLRLHRALSDSPWVEPSFGGVSPGSKLQPVGFPTDVSKPGRSKGYGQEPFDRKQFSRYVAGL